MSERVRVRYSVEIEQYKRMVQMDMIEETINRQMMSYLSNELMKVIKDNIITTKGKREMIFDIDFMIIPTNEYHKSLDSKIQI